MSLSSAENAFYQEAKFAATHDSVLRFTCAFSAQLAALLRRRGEPEYHPEIRRILMQDLVGLRGVLDDFATGETPVDAAVSVLYPVVIESLYHVRVEHVRVMIRAALLSIQKIKV